MIGPVGYSSPGGISQSGYAFLKGSGLPGFERMGAFLGRMSRAQHIALVAQRIEQRFPKPLVGGSSPPEGTILGVRNRR
jgi:hypothetical protein